MPRAAPRRPLVPVLPRPPGDRAAGLRGLARHAAAAALAVAAGLSAAWLPVTALAQHADYAREQRWAEEIVPGLVVGEPVWLRADGRRFLGLLEPGRPERPAIVLVHGIGVHPDHGLIGQLRARLAEAGFTTLSIQMPVLPKEADAAAYGPTFGEAGARIDAAARRLRDDGHARRVLVSHSLGSRMSDAYLAGAQAVPFDAWVCIGLGGALSATEGDGRALPVLDAFGSEDLPAVLSAREQRLRALRAGSPGSRQREFAGAGHQFESHEAELAQAIAEFVDRAVPR